MLKLEDAPGAYGLVDGLQNVGLVIAVDVGVEPGGGRLAGVGDEAAAVEGAQLAPVGVHPVDHVEAGFDQGPEAPVGVLAHTRELKLGAGAGDELPGGRTA
ncbi:MAG: hypothetical protein ABW022_00245 [Actinoplanes sp.]